MSYRANDVTKALINHTLPTKDSCLPPHFVSLFFILSMIGFQKFCPLRLPPTSILKYLNNILIILQLRINEYLLSSLSSIPSPPILLLWNFILRFHASSKHLRILLTTIMFFIICLTSKQYIIYKLQHTCCNIIFPYFNSF